MTYANIVKKVDKVEAIDKKSVLCGCFNSTNQDECKNNVAECRNTESDRPGACFVLWSTDNVTGNCCFCYFYPKNKCMTEFLPLFRCSGATHVKMKGCFTDNACNNTECVDTSERKMNFCCCTGRMCNEQYKWIPTTTVAPKIEGNGI